MEALLARCTFPPAGTTVDLAVSGGPDSLALLALAVHAGLDVTAHHVDHGLRPGSASEADRVEAVAVELGAAFRAERAIVDVGPNLEARARAARYAVLPAGVLTGHTADDQAETVLLNVLRGAGLDGLRGIDPARRPLLALRRAETRELCAALGLDPVQDPSNDDPAFRRNRVRHEVLPLLDDVAGRDVVPLLTRLAAHAGEATEHLDEAAAALDPTDARALRGAPPVLARVALRRWLRAAHPEGRPPDTATVERVLAVATHAAEATDVGGGWRVTRHGGRLQLRPPAATGPAVAPSQPSPGPH